MSLQSSQNCELPSPCWILFRYQRLPRHGKSDVTNLAGKTVLRGITLPSRVTAREIRNKCHKWISSPFYPTWRQWGGISGASKFQNFLGGGGGGGMPPDPPRGSRLRSSSLITPLNKHCCQHEHPSKNLSYEPVSTSRLVLFGICSNLDETRTMSSASRGLQVYLWSSDAISVSFC